MEKKMTAKDIAFEKERAKYRKQINELNRELLEQKQTNRNLVDQISKLEDNVRQKEEWIQRLLSYMELSEEDMRNLLEKDKVISEIANQMQVLGQLFRFPAEKM